MLEIEGGSEDRSTQETDWSTYPAGVRSAYEKEWNELTAVAEKILEVGIRTVLKEELDYARKSQIPLFTAHQIRRDGIEEDICSALLQPRFTLPIGGREGLYYRMLEGDGGLQVCR